MRTSFVSLATKTQELQEISSCRICFQEQLQLSDPLIAPCKCTGSMKHVHLDCLRTWLTRAENVLRNGTQVTSYTWKAFHCDLCKQ